MSTASFKASAFITRMAWLKGLGFRVWGLGFRV